MAKLMLLCFLSGLLTSTGLILFFISGLKENEWLNMGLFVWFLSIPLAIYSLKVQREIARA
jgi:hypothetical protein